MEKYRQTLKYIAASLLLFSFFLPMSSCSYTVPLELGMDETVREPGDVKTEVREVVMYAREYIDLDEPGSWINLLSFLWPVFILGLEFKFKGRRARLTLPSAGISFSILSTVVIFLWADVGKPLIGAYVGWCAALGLLIIYSTELVKVLKEGKNMPEV